MAPQPKNKMSLKKDIIPIPLNVVQVSSLTNSDRHFLKKTVLQGNIRLFLQILGRGKLRGLLKEKKNLPCCRQLRARRVLWPTLRLQVSLPHLPKVLPVLVVVRCLSVPKFPECNYTLWIPGEGKAKQSLPEKHRSKKFFYREGDNRGKKGKSRVKEHVQRTRGRGQWDGGGSTVGGRGLGRAGEMGTTVTEQ